MAMYSSCGRGAELFAFGGNEADLVTSGGFLMSKCQQFVTRVDPMQNRKVAMHYCMERR
jgi:hypothetical protein